MFKEKRLQLKRFVQETGYYCGPACAQIYLSFFSIASPQRLAYSEIENLNTEPNEWYSDPNGLSSYISNVLPDSFDRDIDDFSTVSNNIQTALDRISYTLFHLVIPCIILTDSGGHWEVVDGIRYDESPNGEKEIIGVFIRDPAKTSPDFSYLSIRNFCQTKFFPNQVGTQWRDKYVLLSKPTNENLLVANTRETMIRGGGAPNTPKEIALLNLELQGFTNAQALRGGAGAELVPVVVTGLDGTSNYTIVPLDALQTKEFQDLIYVVIEEGTNTLLEISNISQTLPIYNDSEMQQVLRKLFPARNFEILNGYFWKPCVELRSRLAVARRFRLEGQEMWLLPDGTVVESLTDSAPKGG